MCGSLKMIRTTVLILAGISITCGNHVEPRIFCGGRKNKTGSEICCNSRNGSSLPRHLDKEEGMSIVNQMKMANVTTVWLERQQVELGGLTWTNGTKLVTSQKRLAARNSCGAINSRKRKLVVHHCSKRNIGFICEQKDCVSCLSLGLFRGNCRLVSGVCYVLFCGIDNWYAARATCHRYGMEFATIPNSDTISALSSSKESEVCPLKWIGLRTTEWKLIGSPDLSASWGPGEPSGNGDCVVAHHTLNRHLRWKVASCNSLHNFICVTYLKDQATQSTTNGKRNGATSLTGFPIPLLLFIVAMICNPTYTQETSERNRKPGSSKGSEQSEEHMPSKPHGDEKDVMESEGIEQSGNVHGGIQQSGDESLNLSEDTIETDEESEPGSSANSEGRESLKSAGDTRGGMESKYTEQSGNLHGDVQQGEDEKSPNMSEDSKPGASEESGKFQELEGLKHPCDKTGDLAFEGTEQSENMQGGSQQGDGEESPHLSESDEESDEETEEESVTTKVSRARISSFTQPKAREKFRAPAISLKGAPLTQRLATCLALMLVLGGDVELNPGPNGYSNKSVVGTPQFFKIQSVVGTQKICNIRFGISEKEITLTNQSRSRVRLSLVDSLVGTKEVYSIQPGILMKLPIRNSIGISLKVITVANHSSYLVYFGLVNPLGGPEKLYKIKPDSVMTLPIQNVRADQIGERRQQEKYKYKKRADKRRQQGKNKYRKRAHLRRQQETYQYRKRADQIGERRQQEKYKYRKGADQIGERRQQEKYKYRKRADKRRQQGKNKYRKRADQRRQPGTYGYRQLWYPCIACERAHLRRQQETYQYRKLEELEEIKTGILKARYTQTMLELKKVKPKMGRNLRVMITKRMEEVGSRQQGQHQNEMVEEELGKVKQVLLRYNRDLKWEWEIERTEQQVLGQITKEESKMRRLEQQMQGKIPIHPFLLSLKLEGNIGMRDQQMVRQTRKWEWEIERTEQQVLGQILKEESKMRRLEQQMQGQIPLQPFLRSLNEESKMRTLELQMRGKKADYKEGEGEFGWCLKVATGWPIERIPNMGQHDRTRST